MSLKVGDIFLHKGTSFVSRLIQWGTKSPYSHVSVCASPDLRLSIEAAGGKVRACDILSFKDRYDVYRVKSKYHCNFIGTLNFLVSSLNRPYDYLGVVYLALLKLGLQKSKANLWQKEHDYFCSELVFLAFSEGGGIDIVPEVASAEITSPSDLARSSILYKVDF